MNVYAENRDQSIWGADANESNPRRFLTATKDQVSRGATSLGVGARSCVGEKMAQSDLFYALVRTLEKVELCRVDETGPAKLMNDDSDLFGNPYRQDFIFTEVK